MRREGRFTPAQRRAVAELGGRWCLDERGGRIDLDAVFGRRAPRIVEVGCGAGETLLALAGEHPENDCLGIEVFQPGIGRILQALERHDYRNARLLCADAQEVFETRIAPASLTAVCVFFPDPWPKTRHHKRRLLQPAFMTRVAESLAAHGRMYVATDWEDYAESVLEAARCVPLLQGLGVDGPRVPRPRWRPLTRFEARARRDGRRVHDFAFGLVQVQERPVAAQAVAQRGGEGAQSGG